MYTECKYFKGRNIPITINDGFLYLPDYFNMIFLKQGYLVLNFDKKIIVCNGPSLICLSGKETIINSHIRGSVVSLAFAPKFVNLHLNYNVICSKSYKKIAKEHLFPTFDIFFKHTDIYNGVLPLSHISFKRLTDLFSRIAIQLEEQPIFKWSCKARSELFLIFDMADINLWLLENEGVDIGEMLESIHAEIDTNLSLLNMFKKFNTSAPTVSRKFKNYFGKTAMNYVLNLRLMLCSYVLAFTDININDIAVSYEFNDSTYFSRMFKKHFGISPYDFRTVKRIESDTFLK
ncbi:MAG: hypothetical protein A2Y15_06290 [Clostridiales bacterium GWF2_36_10]|nr:MAG: hypothetical protein A2Y15_06290 [Clostridiales bacterium GWF2_36_10]